MSPGRNSSAGPLTTGRPTAENPGEKFPASVPRPTNKSLHATATARRVVSPATGMSRFVLLWRCSVCSGAFHVAHGRGDVLPAVVERRTVHGLVVLHVADDLAAVAG